MKPVTMLMSLIALVAIDTAAGAQPTSAQAEVLFRQGKELMARGSTPTRAPRSTPRRSSIRRHRPCSTARAAARRTARSPRPGACSSRPSARRAPRPTSVTSRCTGSRPSTRPTSRRACRRSRSTYPPTPGSAASRCCATRTRSTPAHGTGCCRSTAAPTRSPRAPRATSSGRRRSPSRASAMPGPSTFRVSRPPTSAGRQHPKQPRPASWPRPRRAGPPCLAPTPTRSMTGWSTRARWLPFAVGGGALALLGGAIVFERLASQRTLGQDGPRPGPTALALAHRQQRAPRGRGSRGSRRGSRRGRGVAVLARPALGALDRRHGPGEQRSHRRPDRGRLLMRAVLVVLAAAACGFPALHGDGGMPPDEGGTEPPEPCPDGGCQLLAIEPSIANTGDTITLEGSFAAHATVQFAGGASAPATVLGPHRATAVVPAAATAGELTVTSGGATVGPVSFRRAAFQLGLQRFQAFDDQSNGARTMDIARHRPQCRRPDCRRCARLRLRHRWKQPGRPADRDDRASADQHRRVARRLRDRSHDADPSAVVGCRGRDWRLPLRARRRRERNGRARGGPGRWCSLATFALVSPLTRPRFRSTVNLIGNSLYVVGGDDGASDLRSVERAIVAPDASLGSFAVTAPTLTAPRNNAYSVSSAPAYT